MIKASFSICCMSIRMLALYSPSPWWQGAGERGPRGAVPRLCAALRTHPPPKPPTDFPARSASPPASAPDSPVEQWGDGLMCCIQHCAVDLESQMFEGFASAQQSLQCSFVGPDLQTFHSGSPLPAIDKQMLLSKGASCQSK